MKFNMLNCFEALCNARLVAQKFNLLLMLNLKTNDQ